MKDNKSQKVKLGIFVSIGLMLLIATIYVIGSRRGHFGTNFHIKAYFHNISGLQDGALVSFDGLTVGTVEDIEIESDTLVRVGMLISGKYHKFFRKDISAHVSSDGLMGNKIINISPGHGDAPPVDDNATISTERQVSTDEIMAGLKETVDNSRKITGDLADIFHDLNSGKGTIGTLISDPVFAANTKAVMQNAKDMTDRIKNGQGALGLLIYNEGLAANINTSVLNVKNGTRGFSDNMEALQHSFLLKGPMRKKAKADERNQAEEKSMQGDSIPVQK
jgi:phospholipid/cholesterol/gamma-HCH transport system substrate-binding protein